jgi:hypothetical protein
MSHFKPKSKTKKQWYKPRSKSHLRPNPRRRRRNRD